MIPGKYAASTLGLAASLLVLALVTVRTGYCGAAPVPLLLIVMMSWLVFWISQALGSVKISTGVTSMLTLIAYRLAIGNDVPKLPYLTLLDAFILVSTVLVVLALIMVVTSTAMWSNGRQDPVRAIDQRCRVMFPAVFVASIASIILF